MLNALSIRNFALIDRLEIEFGKGLNVLSGETGAGKSIVMDAIGLLLGEKGGAGLLRKDADKCQIIGRFSVEKNKLALKYLDELSIETGDEDLIIRREIDAAGKSKCFLNDQPVTLAALAHLGDYLIDVHGQHDHQLLLKSGEQRELVDRFGGHETLRKTVAELCAQWREYAAKLETSQVSDQERNSKIDLYDFQVKEISAAKLVAGEEEEIERLLPQLKNAEKLRSLSDEIHSHLYEAEGSVVDRLQKTQKILETMRNLGVETGECPVWVEEALIKARETADFAESFGKNLPSDSGQLDDSLSRLEQISKMKRKYGKDVRGILEYFETKKLELDQLKNYEGTQKELKENVEKSYAQLLGVARKLTAGREKAGAKLSEAIQKELKDLGFLKAQFSIQLAAEKDENGKPVPSAQGLEKIEFLFSANPGEDLKPLKNVASGGELSRIMLALKKILADSDVVPTLIFDEIDTGLGGSMGHVLGEKLKALSRTHQILLITHLPQIAAFADRQFTVKKAAAGNKTEVSIEAVEKEKRVQEIARMLGGITGKSDRPSEISLKHAAELLSAGTR